MTFAMLGLIALVQVLFGALVIGYLFLRRVQRPREAAVRRRASAHVAAPFRGWLVADGDVHQVAAALRALPPDLALEHAATLVTQRVPLERLGPLARALRDEPWAQHALASATSRRWWRRLDAACALSVVGGPDDAALLGRLLDDPHTAVQSMATRSIGQVADDALVRDIVARLPSRTNIVRHSQFRALRGLWQAAVPALVERLTPDSPPAALTIWIALAGALEVPAGLAACVPLHTHPDPNVRAAVAKVLKSYFHPDATAALERMLVDDDWRVRGQAARALGALGADSALPLLVRAAADPSWWVRFRATLSLAQLGERGRRALRDLRAGPDRYGREMATLISGLSDGGVTELAEL